MSDFVKPYDATWNPWYGCHKISNGCAKCKSYVEMYERAKDPNKVVRSQEKSFNKPLLGLNGPIISVCEWSDFFIVQANPWRADAWQIIRECDHLVFMICTRRPGSMVKHLPPDWGEDGYPNVWLGVAVEDQKSADARIPYLQQISAPVKFVQVEPLLGPVNLSKWTTEGHLDWVLCGGEIGPTSRPMCVKHATDVLIDCLHDDVPFFFKQMGGNEQINGVYGGDELNGEQFHDMPYNCVGRSK